MYTDTSSKLAAESGSTTPTVLHYAKLGLLEHVVASNGTFLFKAGQAPLVREIKRQRLEARFSRKRA